MADSEIGATFVLSPGWPASPNELLKADPSTLMLFMRPSWPASVQPVDSEQPPNWGVSRTIDSNFPVIVGRVASASLLTVVAAPVLEEFMILSTPAAPVTFTSSNVTAAARRTKSRSDV